MCTDVSFTLSQSTISLGHRKVNTMATRITWTTTVTVSIILVGSMSLAAKVMASAGRPPLPTGSFVLGILSDSPGERFPPPQDQTAWRQFGPLLEYRPGTLCRSLEDRRRKLEEEAGWLERDAKVQNARAAATRPNLEKAQQDYAYRAGGEYKKKLLTPPTVVTSEREADHWVRVGMEEATARMDKYRKDIDTYLKDVNEKQQALASVREELSTLSQQKTACHEEAARRSQERASLAESRPAEEILAIPQDLRTPEENARLALERDEREQERKERIAERQASARWMQAPLSAAICIYQLAKRNALTEVATERRYARSVSGLVDRRKLYNLQQLVRGADEGSAAIHATAKRLRVQLLGCNAGIVRRTMPCLPVPLDYPVDFDGFPDACDTPDVKDYKEIAPEIAPE